MVDENAHRLWTFRVRSTKEFTLQPPGNPSAIHPGGTSVFHFMLTQGQAKQVEAALVGLGARVDMRQAEEQTEAQRDERRALLGRGKEETVYPSAVCPTCFWFDPTIEGVCGRAGWTVEVVEASLEAHEAARKCEAECPVAPEGGW